MTWLSEPGALGRFLVTAFFAVVFLQSGLDKLLDRQGNLAYFADHFRNSPFPAGSVPWLLSALTAIELAAGGLCALGVVSGAFARRGANAASWGVAAAGVALLCLILGQRLAKDYEGAAVVAAYFAVALIGLALF